jgi:hypothetical protein
MCVCTHARVRACVRAYVLDREIEVDSLPLDYGMGISCDTCLPLIWCRWRLGRDDWVEIDVSECWSTSVSDVRETRW